MSALQTLPVGIVVERREIDNPWEDFSWHPVAVIPGAPPLADDLDWRLLREDEGWRHFFIGTRELELFWRETEGYKANLANTPARVYVVLSRGEEADEPFKKRKDKPYGPRKGGFNKRPQADVNADIGRKVRDDG